MGAMLMQKVFLWIVTAIMLHKRNVEFRSRASVRRTTSDWQEYLFWTYVDVLSLATAFA